MNTSFVYVQEAIVLKGIPKERFRDSWRHSLRSIRLRNHSGTIKANTTNERATKHMPARTLSCALVVQKFEDCNVFDILKQLGLLLKAAATDIRDTEIEALGVTFGLCLTTLCGREYRPVSANSKSSDNTTMETCLKHFHCRL